MKFDDVQNVYGKRRGMIRVDIFLEQLKQARIGQESAGQDPSAPNKNWLEEDLYRINNSRSPISSA